MRLREGDVELDLSKLEVGMVVKNYKEMCGLLGEEVKGGAAKVAQIKKWGRSFEFEQKGHKIIIKEVYDNEKILLIADQMDKLELLTHRDMMDKLILEYLMSEEQKVLINTKTTLMIKLCMINNSYSDIRKIPRQFSKFINADLANVDEFYDLTHRSLTDTLKSSLARLNSQDIIEFTEPFWIYAAPSGFKGEISKKIIDHDKFKKPIYEYIDKNNKIVEFNHRQATNSEVEEILTAISEAKSELGFQDKKMIWMKGLWKEYLQIINDKLFKRIFAEYHYRPYKIIFSKKGAAYEYNCRRLPNVEFEQFKKTLNDYFVNRFNDSAKNRHDSIENEKEWFTMNDKERRRVDEKYIDDFKLITHCLIDKQSDNVINQVLFLDFSEEE